MDNQAMPLDTNEEQLKTMDTIIADLTTLNIGEVSVFDVKEGHDLTETLGSYMGKCKVIIIGRDNQLRKEDMNYATT